MNFQELAQKLRTIDEGGIVECGEMMPMHTPAPMPQQDSVSMNVSMNAQGKGGIRDLMQVLQNIEQGSHNVAAPITDIGPDDMQLDVEPAGADSMMGGDVEVEPGQDAIVFGGEEEPEFGHEGPAAELDAQAQDGKGVDSKVKHAIAPVVQAVGLAHALGKDPEEILGDKMADEDDMTTSMPMPTTDQQPTDMSSSGPEELASEEYANRPNAKYQSQNYMTKTLAQGADEPQRMHKHSYRMGDNPMAMKEGLQGRLASLYQDVKLRESQNVTEVLDTPERRAAYQAKAKASVPALNQQYSDARRKAGRDHVPGGEEGLRKHGDQAQLAKADAIKNKILKRREYDEAYNPNSVDAEHRRSLNKAHEDNLKKKAEDGDASAKKHLQALKDKKERMSNDYNARMER